jgi:hypothetical protein
MCNTKPSAEAAKPFGWVKRSERDGFPPAYAFTRDSNTAERWRRAGESPRDLYALPPQGELRAALAELQSALFWWDIRPDVKNQNEVFKAARNAVAVLAGRKDG